MDVERTALPGLGLQHVFTTGRGRRVGVVSHHSGRRDLVIYDSHDPDSAAETVVLTADEANGLAELLGTVRVVERLAALARQVEGLVTTQVPVNAGSPYEGRPLGDTQARTRTGASIVAVVRGGTVLASPRPDFVFLAGDTVVVVGTEEGTTAVADLFRTG
jgi:TrkA domain protein